MRDLDTIIIHCSATPASMDIGVDEIRDWHMNGNGWSGIGYHYVIRRDGTLEDGRPVEVVGAHAKGHNEGSIAICMVGGTEKRKACANFNLRQYKCLYSLVDYLKERYSIEKVIGHNQVSSKACPSFDVSSFFDFEEV